MLAVLGAASKISLATLPEDVVRIIIKVGIESVDNMKLVRFKMLLLLVKVFHWINLRKMNVKDEQTILKIDSGQQALKITNLINQNVLDFVSMECASR